MDLIDKQYVPFFKRGQNPHKIAGTMQCRPRRRIKLGAHLVGYDMCQSRFAQAGRPVKKSMLDWLLALPGGIERYLKLAA